MEPITMALLAAPSLAGAATKYFRGLRQEREARKINPIDPGPNRALQDNANLLYDRYSNYTTPGFTRAVGDVNRSASAGYSAAMQGATSGADVLDAATRIAYGTSQSLNNLNAQEAAGRDQAMFDYLNANAAAGTDRSNWERSKYMQDRQDKANLMNAGQANTMGALQEGANALSTVAAYSLANPGNRIVNPSPGSPGYISTVRPGATVSVNPMATGANLPPLATGYVGDFDRPINSMLTLPYRRNG